MAGVDFDLFDTFRWLLALVCAVYALVCTARTLWGWLAYFSGSRETAVLGHYALVLLLRTRVRPFAWEFLQIAVLLSALGYLISLHG